MTAFGVCVIPTSRDRGTNSLIHVAIRGGALITRFSVLDHLDTRLRKLVVYSSYIPPLFSLLTPTGSDHIPYIVMQPPGVPWTGWPIAGHDVEGDNTIPSVPVR